MEWHGPFVFVPQPGFQCVFNQELATRPGLYLWTIEYERGYLINYVGKAGRGKTKRSLAVRLKEDVQWAYSGNDGRVCDPALFRLGKIENSFRFSFPDFLADYQRISTRVHEVYCTYRVFVSPLELEDRTLELVEAGIIRCLRSSGGTSSSFLSNKRLIQASQQLFKARMVMPVFFHGLNESICC